jgi:hypothetical protein
MNVPHFPVPSSGVPDAGTPGMGNRCLRLLAGTLVIFVFAFGVIPAIQRMEGVREVHEAIDRSGIDASALFYTESDVSSAAESSIRNALKYPANRPDGSSFSPTDRQGRSSAAK